MKINSIYEPMGVGEQKERISARPRLLNLQWETNLWGVRRYTSLSYLWFHAICVDVMTVSSSKQLWCAEDCGEAPVGENMEKVYLSLHWCSRSKCIPTCIRARKKDGQLLPKRVRDQCWYSPTHAPQQQIYFPQKLNTVLGLRQAYIFIFPHFVSLTRLGARVGE